MKIYHFGAEDAPVLLLLPGTCCHWKSNFGAVIPLLADSFRVFSKNDITPPSFCLSFTMQYFLPDAPTAPDDRPAIPRAES